MNPCRAPRDPCHRQACILLTSISGDMVGQGHVAFSIRPTITSSNGSHSLQDQTGERSHGLAASTLSCFALLTDACAVSCHLDVVVERFWNFNLKATEFIIVIFEYYNARLLCCSKVFDFLLFFLYSWSDLVETQTFQKENPLVFDDFAKELKCSWEDFSEILSEITSA
jgi:hypothetical protein